jgi:putative alpha-1,2-mannosidase
MYPVIPGTDVLVVHGPQFQSAVVHLANGKTVTIGGEGAGPKASYIQSLSVDGTATTRNWLHFSDIADGAALQFTMGGSANKGWGSGDADRPPSFGQ